jgi:hypothetical protein
MKNAIGQRGRADGRPSGLAVVAFSLPGFPGGHDRMPQAHETFNVDDVLAGTEAAVAMAPELSNRIVSMPVSGYGATVSIGEAI